MVKQKKKLNYKVRFKISIIESNPVYLLLLAL